VFAGRLHCYGLIEDFVSIHEGRATTLSVRSQRQAPVRHTNAIVISKDLDQRLLQWEIMGLFALLLAGSRNNEPLWHLDWLRCPDPLSYAPSWVARRDGEGAKVWLRTRGTESSVKRLFARYTGRLFRHDPNPERSSRSYCDLNASGCGIQPEPLGKRLANMGTTHEDFRARTAAAWAAVCHRFAIASASSATSDSSASASRTASE
jgi:hypothetical protein